MPEISIFQQKRTRAVYDLQAIRVLIENACLQNLADLRAGNFRKKLIFVTPSKGKILLTSKLRVLNDLGFICCNCGISATKCLERDYSKHDYKIGCADPLRSNATLRFFGDNADRQQEITVDHVVPLSLGGTDEAGNLIPLCSKCNSRKGNRQTHRVQTMYRHRDILGALIQLNPDKTLEIERNYSETRKNLLFMIPSLNRADALIYAKDICSNGALPDLERLASKRMPDGILSDITDPWLSELAERSQAVINSFPTYR